MRKIATSEARTAFPGRSFGGPLLVGTMFRQQNTRLEPWGEIHSLRLEVSTLATRAGSRYGTSYTERASYELQIWKGTAVKEEGVFADGVL